MTEPVDAGESFDELAPIPMRPVDPEDAAKILQMPKPAAGNPEMTFDHWRRRGYRIAHCHKHDVGDPANPALVVLILAKG